MARERVSGWISSDFTRGGLGDPTYVSTKGLGDSLGAEMAGRAAVQTWVGGVWVDWTPS